MGVRSKFLPQGLEKFDFARIAFLAIAHVLAVVGLLNFTWDGLLAFLILYVVTGMGITFGFHRLFTHRSFKVPKFLEVLAALAGTLAMQGNLLRWVAHHRMHHAFSDEGADPHNASRGFWYSHILWVCYANGERDRPKKLRRFARDVAGDRVLMLISSDSFMVCLQAVLLAVLWSVWSWQVMLWGIWVRMVAVYHATWLVNSAAHKWGYRNYQDGDQATNCWWVGLLAFGEGWHNNHHAHRNVAPAGRQWWELDITWFFIRFLRFLGLATEVRIPPALKLDPNAASKKPN